MLIMRAEKRQATSYISPRYLANIENKGQQELTEKLKSDREMVNAYEQDKADFDSFVAVIRKYVGITKLISTIVNKFMKKIIVHALDKSSGHRRQKIQIIWNFMGELKQAKDKQTIERQRKSRTA